MGPKKNSDKPASGSSEKKEEKKKPASASTSKAHDIRMVPEGNKS